MYIKKSVLFSLLACMALSSAAMAQQGHPLDGIWLGDWGTSKDDRNYVVLELHWMNTTLSGTINPGFPDAATVEVSELDSANWTVHLEAVGKDENGRDVRTVIDGQLDNLGLPNRTLKGTWRYRGATGDFALTRE
jgi:hypothetical protein